jgi:hypothetical protein
MVETFVIRYQKRTYNYEKTDIIYGIKNAIKMTIQLLSIVKKIIYLF